MINTKITNFISFSIFFIAVLSHFLFDIFAPIYLDSDFFRQVINLRSNLIIFTAFLVLGIDQAIIRFSGVVLNIFKYYFLLLSIIVACSFLGFYFEFINFEILLFIIAVAMYAVGLVLSSIYRIQEQNHKSQLLINGWRLTLHTLAFLFSSSFIENKLLPFYLLIFSVFIPLLFFVFRTKIITIELDNKREFVLFAVIFMIFIVMLAFSQYYDQLFASNFLRSDMLKEYIFVSAFFIAPCTILSTFLGFILAPKFAKISNEDVKRKYRKILGSISICYPFFAMALYVVYLIATNILNFKPDYPLVLIFGFTLVGFLRFIYSLNSSVMGMKSHKTGLFYFFLFCVTGIIFQLLILFFLATNSGDRIIFYIITALIVNWSLRNYGAYYLIERYF
nr:hypothetical protein [uncultured Shewanella sp.]